MTLPNGRLLILSQVYVPDAAAVGQYLHDSAREMVRRGFDVVVICAARGYDDPTKTYPSYEVRDGVRIRRYRLPFFSKGNLILRIAGSVWAMLALFWIALRTEKVTCVIFSTSPPLVGMIGITVAALKRAASVYWAMDLNPDQLVAMKKIRGDSLRYRALESINRIILSRSTLTVALDRFMADRLRTGGRRPREVMYHALWPHEEACGPGDGEALGTNLFRNRHGIGNRFIVMYSGNHSPANPLDTLLSAMVDFKGDDGIRFAFIGGGADKAKVRAFIAQHAITNALELPYQPLESLGFSLQAADVHVVTLGNQMVGIVHPCKIYGAMQAARPILFIGPRPSHVADILDDAHIGEIVSHGDVVACVAAIRRLRGMTSGARTAMGNTARQIVRTRLSEKALNGQFCDAIERVSASAAAT